MSTSRQVIPAGRAIRSIDVPLLEQLFDHVLEIAFFIKDCNGLYVSVNQSLVTRHGLRDRSEAIGRRPMDICPGDFGRIPTVQDESVLATGRPIIDHLEMQWHVPNDPVWCLTTKLPILDNAQAIVGIIGFSRDIRVTMDRAEVPEGFGAVLEEFEQDLPPEATPSWLASRCGVSPQRFARVMKRVFDVTPSQYITKTRIAAASRMLLDTDHTVAEIAHACGFYDHSAFSRAFRMATGATPSEFRGHWQDVVRAKKSS